MASTFSFLANPGTNVGLWEGDIVLRTNASSIVLSRASVPGAFETALWPLLSSSSSPSRLRLLGSAGLLDYSQTIVVQLAPGDVARGAGYLIQLPVIVSHGIRGQGDLETHRVTKLFPP